VRGRGLSASGPAAVAIDADDAEEYTQSLGQIGAGLWRQIAWAQRQGIPDALGLTTQEWVEHRLGGYVKLAIPERREAVRELVAEGMSQRQIASVLGVGLGTVHGDVQNRTLGDENIGPDQDEYSLDVQNRTPDDDEFERTEALLRQAADTAELLHTVTTERRPKPPIAPPSHPATNLLWARVAELRDLTLSDATVDQRGELITATDHLSEQVDRLSKELRA
jgi:hypothetical protein